MSDKQLRSIETFIHEVRLRGYHPDLLRPVQEVLGPLPENQQVSVFLGLAETVGFYERDTTACPPMREAMLIQALLPLASSNSAKSILDLQAHSLVLGVFQRLAQVGFNLAAEPRSLLRRPPSFGELFFLPIRVVRLLGWIGFAALHPSSTTHLPFLHSLARRVVDLYGNSIAMLDERQAASLLLFLIAARVNNWEDESSEVLGRSFNDFYRSMGRIARRDSDGRQRVRYLLNRYNEDVDLAELVEKPSELLGAVLVMGAVTGFDGVWDADLQRFDRLHINFFFPERPFEFADQRIAHGENLSMEVGTDFHKLSELRRATQDLQVSDAMSEWALHPAIDAMSLFLPDRPNWSRLSQMRADGAIVTYRPQLTVTIDDPSAPTILIHVKGQP